MIFKINNFIFNYFLDYKGIKTSSSPPPETSQPNSNPPSLNIGIKSESPGDQSEHKNFRDWILQQ